MPRKIIPTSQVEPLKPIMGVIEPEVDATPKFIDGLKNYPGFTPKEHKGYKELCPQDKVKYRLYDKYVHIIAQGLLKDDVDRLRKEIKEADLTDTCRQKLLASIKFF